MTLTLDSSPTSTEVETSGPPSPIPGRWLGFAAVMASSVMELMDSTIINVAAPAIREDLGGSYASLQWMAAGYTLTLAVVLLVGGRLGDMFGRRRMLLVGIVGFTAASVLCSIAMSPEVLIGSRVLQGVFGAIMMPQGFGLIRDLFPPHEMGKAFGAFGPVMGLSAVLGPIIGGFLVHLDLFGTGWRMIFLVNVPIGALACYLGVKYLPARDTTARAARLDLVGVLLAGAGTFLLIFPLVQGRELGWPTWTLAMLVSAAPVFLAFAWHQVRRQRAGRTPLVEPRVFTRRSYVSGVVFAIVFFGAMAGIMLTIGVFLQVGLGYTPIHASLTMAPWAMGAIIGSAFGGATMPRLGRKLLHIGLSLMGAGVAGLYLVLTASGTDFGFLMVATPLLLGGTGMGMIFVPLFDIILGGVEDHEVGSATGALGSFEQLGMALGIAVLGTIFFGLLGSQPDLHAHQLSAVNAAGITSLATLGLIGLAFGLGFLLPKKARAQR